MQKKEGYVMQNIWWSEDTISSRQSFGLFKTEKEK